MFNFVCRHLVTTRLDAVAHFATLGSEGLLILWFTLHQIPYILPIAISDIQFDFSNYLSAKTLPKP